MRAGRARLTLAADAGMTTESESGVDLYWLPLGAGGHSVRLNGRIFEAVAARLERRPPCDLYHTALEVRVPDGRYVIEQTPIPYRSDGERGLVAEGAVGSRWAGRFRLFRYEVRCWRGGTIPDVSEAVKSPQRPTQDPEVAQRVLDPGCPGSQAGLGSRRARCGRDVELQLDDRLADLRSGLSAGSINPPAGGRAPGWRAGLIVARRQRTGPASPDLPPRRGSTAETDRTA
jgi:hypothetical protein